MTDETYAPPDAAGPNQAPPVEDPPGNAEEPAAAAAATAAAAANPTPTPTTAPPPPPEPQPFEISLARSLQSRSSSLLTTFLRLDGDGDGYVDRSDLRVALHNSLGVDLTHDQLDAIFARFAYFEDDGRDALPYDDDDDDDDDDGGGGGGSDEATGGQVVGQPSSSKRGHRRRRHHGIRYQEFVRYITETASSPTLSPSSPYGSTLSIVPPADPRRPSLEPIHLPPSARARQLRQSLARSIRSHTSATSSGASGSSTSDLFLKIDAHRTGSITVEEFRDFVEGVGFLWTEEQLALALGEHYHPSRGVDYREFVRTVEDLDDGDDDDGEADGEGGEGEGEKKKVDDGFGADVSDEEKRRRALRAADEADRRAKELLRTSVRKCADDSKTDGEIVRAIATRLYARHTLMVDAFRRYDLDGTRRLDGRELREALAEAGMDVSESRAEGLVRRFDKDGDGGLSLSEFVRLVSWSSSVDDDGDSGGDGGGEGGAGVGGGTTSDGDGAGAAAAAAGAAAAGADAEDSADAAAEIAPPPEQEETGATAAAPPAEEAVPAPSSIEDVRESLVSAVLGHGDDADDSRLDNGRLDDDDVSAIVMLRDALDAERVVARRAFRRFDTDGSRDLTAEELREGLEGLGINVSEEHVDHIMHRFDPEGTGRLKYYQFVKLLSADLGV